jgi:hypothetical protein
MNRAFSPYLPSDHSAQPLVWAGMEARLRCWQGDLPLAGRNVAGGGAGNKPTRDLLAALPPMAPLTPCVGGRTVAVVWLSRRAFNQTTADYEREAMHSACSVVDDYVRAFSGAILSAPLPRAARFSCGFSEKSSQHLSPNCFRQAVAWALKAISVCSCWKKRSKSCGSSRTPQAPA